MIGGIVKETNTIKEGVEIVVEDEGELLSVEVKVTAESRSVSEGDSIWWQGRKAYWTPRNKYGRIQGNASDIQLYRIGYSRIPRSVLS
tara:strand:- start:11 stop:274 length:264 start_codon:yes stop_codon:yes gene_type:complete